MAGEGPQAGTAQASSAIRERNVTAVLETLGSMGAASRLDLADRTGLSKPTVGSALRLLAHGGLVREVGFTTGNRGPKAALHTIDADAVRVVGIDIGARFLRATVADLLGSPLQQETIALQTPTLETVMAAIGELSDRIEGHRPALRLAVVGAPGVVDTPTGTVRSAPNIAGMEGRGVGHLIGERIGLPTLVENDVNLAAIGERDRGSGRGIDSFCYLLVGSGVGAGIVLDGRLHRGAHGAAGEVSFLPLGADPFAGGAASAHRGAMENRLSGDAIVAQAMALAATIETGLTEPYTSAMLFDAALRGDRLGRAVTAYAAKEIALCIASITAVVDLELVLLGGGIGASSEFLLGAVRECLAQLIPSPPSVIVATLGDRAVQLGAVSVALGTAVPALIGELVASDADELVAN